MVTTSRTGNTRYRLHKPLLRRAVLVLQVELRTQGYYFGPDPGDTHGTDIDLCTWRDATVEDLTWCAGQAK